MQVIYNIPAGMRGTDTTIAFMEKLAFEAAKKEPVRALAEQILRISNVKERDTVREVNAIHKFVQSRLRYTQDNALAETIKHPLRMIREIREFGYFIGDCDDASVLEASLLLSVGYPIRFATISTDKNAAGMTHVYLQAKINNTWISLDPIVKQKSVGWEAKNYIKKKSTNKLEEMIW